MPLSYNDIESELSYAYIHAVAAAAGMACKVGDRHDDNHGVDANITAWLDPEGEDLIEVDFKVQLKATVAAPRDENQCLSYRLRGRRRYDALRADGLAVPRILVVLFLPPQAVDWLGHTDEQLVLKKCAYWESLRGAAEIEADSVDLWLPKAQVFSPDALHRLARRFARLEMPRYNRA